MKKNDLTSNRGIDLYRKAKKIIPGGTQLLSKRPELFLPDLWPAYYSKAKGYTVWDLDGNKYYDFAQMGVGSCVLGYADKDVNKAVSSAIANGSMCSLNCYEEIQLAEKMIELHPWADMVRYARTGGEACAIAVRIARAASGKDIVAFCGYHGWSDWYISANIAENSNLDGQLLPGLEPKGIPRHLKGTSIPFHYNKIGELQKITEENKDQIGVIIMEPQRDVPPEAGFLEGVKEIAGKIGAVLIFDEITSGFRMNVGGIHLQSKVFPDMAVFGKALGNGYPISCVIGRREIMESAQDTFISSTMWTERIGFTAGIVTLKKMIARNVPEYLIHYGNLINQGWIKAANETGLKIKISGIPPLTHLAFNGTNAIEQQTFYAQEMLKRGYLLGASVYTTYVYDEKLIERFINDTVEVFQLIATALKSNNLAGYLIGKPIMPGFKRLTS